MVLNNGTLEVLVLLSDTRIKVVYYVDFQQITLKIKKNMITVPRIICIFYANLKKYQVFMS